MLELRRLKLEYCRDPSVSALDAELEATATLGIKGRGWRQRLDRGHDALEGPNYHHGGLESAYWDHPRAFQMRLECMNKLARIAKQW